MNKIFDFLSSAILDPPSWIFRIFKIWLQIHDQRPQKPPNKKSRMDFEKHMDKRVKRIRVAI